ncbi:cytochrome c oxidase assembly protein [Angustibacter sp. McL0619]|uniref:cytochrome c oxidase assembly protein n=1 Tax=Angustibacter sp. McL0619 TaxID=3415676 RepID=UPI003CE8F7E0
MAATETLPRGLRLTTVAATITAAAVLAAVAGLLLTGASDSLALADAGALTRWGLPLVRVLSDVAASLTVGLLVLAAVALPPNGTGRRGAGPAARGAGSPQLEGVTLAMVRLAGGTALVWAAAGGAVLVLSYARLAGIAPGAPGFAEQLGQFITQIDLLRSLLISSLVVVVVATGAIVATRVNTVGWMAVLAVGALLPVALTGHAAGSLDHEAAVDSLAFHLVGVTVWVGGLAALVLLRGSVRGGQIAVVRRYSTMALWAFVTVAASGAVNAWLRLGGWEGLATRYGLLVIAKVVALLLLGLAGLLHRRRTIAAIEATTAAAQGAAASARAAFWRLVSAELVVMGVAIGVAVALANSAPPRAETVSTDAALVLTGYPMPAPLHLASWLTAWRLDLLWTTVAGLLLVLYLVGAARLTRRGDGWPVLRTVSWVAGCLVLVWATGGAPGIYGRVLFSAHMMGHMTMSMVVPALLVLGAPVTLALRALPARQDGSRGPREWLLSVVHSRVLAVLGHPLVACALFAGSLIAFYYSPLFGLSLRTHTGHVLMNSHFLLVGYLFANVMIGVDPGPARPPYPMRLLLLFATMAFHAFFGVALVQGSQLLAPDVLTQLGRTWGRSPLADQQYGGAVAWGVGELPVLLLGMGIAIAWVRSDDREAKRRDRQADRDGEAELTEYNARLAELAAHDDDREVRR